MPQQHEIRQELGRMSDDDVADRMAYYGNNNVITAQAEFLLRQTKAAKESAQATKATAAYTKRNARYMLWSVIVLAVSSAITALISLIRLCHT